MNDIETKQKLRALIREAEEQFSGTGKALLDIEDYVAEYLTAKGVIAPPCKVGDVVCKIESPFPFIEEYEVDDILNSFKLVGGDYIHKLCYARCDDFGKTVFLSREEAERALKGAGDGKAD